MNCFYIAENSEVLYYSQFNSLEFLDDDYVLIKNSGYGAVSDEKAVRSLKEVIIPERF